MTRPDPFTTMPELKLEPTHDRAVVPDLSVIVIVPDRFETVARTVGHLAAQTARERLELVFVTPDPALMIPSDAVAWFCGWSLVHITHLTSTAAARVEGIRRARASVVAFVEDHCFPTPTWGEALIAAHTGPWAGVGPAVFNANPATRVSWANLLIEYGPWLAPRGNGAWQHIPGHNSSYKRDILVSCGDRLGALMEAESVLQWTLQRTGHRFTIEPAAHTRHENFSRFDASIRLRFHGGRSFAASRGEKWSVARRLLYAGGSPLIPFVRVWRARRDRARVGMAADKPGVLIVTFALLVADAAGELFGYLTGAGDSVAQLTNLEFHRERFLTDRDRATIRRTSAPSPSREPA
jgi:hypothetical protein